MGKGGAGRNERKNWTFKRVFKVIPGFTQDSSLSITLSAMSKFVGQVAIFQASSQVGLASTLTWHAPCLHFISQSVFTVAAYNSSLLFPWVDDVFKNQDQLKNSARTSTMSPEDIVQ